MPFRFIHAADLHLGKKFLSIPEPPDGTVRGRLREARHAAIGLIAQAARDTGAAHVLLAGDTFDSATPSPQVVRQALAAMAEGGDVTWWLLPGNHDSLHGAEALWDQVRADAPACVRVIDSAAPRMPEDGVTLLPCPILQRSGGIDPTAGLDAAESPEGALRIGLAHGGVTDFTSAGDAIAPDRDRRARLDYLALGDWHGRMAVSARVHYAGSPEQDRFKHDRRGRCLAVTLDGPGAEPAVDEIETGTFLWTERGFVLHPRQDAAAALRAVLPETGRRDTMLRAAPSGWAGLPDRAALEHAARDVAPDFAHFALETAALQTHHEPADLDEIDRAGALRNAADALLHQAGNDALPQDARRVAKDALARLYAFVKETEA